jgi:hypothetical protein
LPSVIVGDSAGIRISIGMVQSPNQRPFAESRRRSNRKT